CYRKRYGESPSATLLRCRPALAGHASSLPILWSAVERPTIAMLPFPSIGTQARRVVGLADEIAMALLQLRWINVTAPEHARYHLRGRVHDNNKGLLRVTIVLVDALSGRYIWAENWTGDCNDVPAFEERVAIGIARAIVPTLRDAEIARACRKEPAELNA